MLALAIVTMQMFWLLFVFENSITSFPKFSAVSKMRSKQERIRELIVHKKQENPDFSHNDIAKSLKLAKSTVTYVLKNFNERKTTARKAGSGGKKGFKCEQKAKEVISAFKRNPRLSIRDVAKKVNMSPGYVQKVRRERGLQSFKVRLAPNRSDKQNSSAKTRSRKLYDKIIHNFDCVIMDDETYVKADFNQLPGHQFYTAKKKGEVADKFKKKKVDKFAKKYLVWQAICKCGLKSSFFITSGTVDQNIYIKECLNKRLLPLIRQHKGPVLFWPDLATCHYGKLAMKWYEDNGVNIVPKDANPPNCPELRPIEKYWAIMKRKLLKSNKIVKNEKQMMKAWMKLSLEITKADVQRLMAHVNSKLRNFAYNTTT